MSVREQTLVGQIQNLVRFADKTIANLYLTVRQERGALLCFLFHSLFSDEQQIEQNMVDPLQRTTVAQFRQFIAYYLDCGYRFICETDLLNGLDKDGKYALITFDDGYFNNVMARPVLEEYDVPALFFISTDHVRQNKSFWWDVLYRERIAQGTSPNEIYREAVALKTLRTNQMEEILLNRFGKNAFMPRGDIDRPFSPAELRDFANSPHVHLGNHTAEHAILTNYPRERIREEIAEAQAWLEKQTSAPVVSIAYPDGAFNPVVLELCAELGLKAGFTVQPTKNLLPLKPSSMLILSRFAPHDADSMQSQCRTYRSDLLIYNTFREAYLRLAGRRVMH